MSEGTLIGRRLEGNESGTRYRSLLDWQSLPRSRVHDPASAKEVIAPPSTSRLDRRMSRRSPSQTAGSTSRKLSVEPILVTLSSDSEENTPSRKCKSVIPTQNDSPGAFLSAPKRSKKPKVGETTTPQRVRSTVILSIWTRAPPLKASGQRFYLVWRRRRPIPKLLRQTPRLVFMNQHLPSLFCFSCNNTNSLRLYPLGHGRLRHPGIEDGRACEGL